MLPKEVFKKIRQIDIVSNRIVTDVLAGRYHSIFKGQGIEFSEVREYQVGDDIRSIDWNLFARFGHPYIKKFVEERELTVILLIDASASTYFGTKGKFKSDIMAQIAALFSFSAIRNNDKVGLLLFSDQLELYVPPKKVKSHVLKLIRDILYFKPKGTKTNLRDAFEYLNQVLKKRSVVFVFSDFIDKDYETALKIMNKKHDVIPVVIHDPMEQELPAFSGLIEFEDSENHETFLADVKKIKDQYLIYKKNIKDQREKFFRGNNIEAINIATNEDYVKPIIKYFKVRERKQIR